MGKAKKPAQDAASIDSEALTAEQAPGELKRLAKEIARMLSGTAVTAEARAAAESLIAGAR